MLILCAVPCCALCFFSCNGPKTTTPVKHCITRAADGCTYIYAPAAGPSPKMAVARRPTFHCSRARARVGPSLYSLSRTPPGNLYNHEIESGKSCAKLKNIFAPGGQSRRNNFRCAPLALALHSRPAVASQRRAAFLPQLKGLRQAIGIVFLYTVQYGALSRRPRARVYMYII